MITDKKQTAQNDKGSHRIRQAKLGNTEEELINKDRQLRHLVYQHFGVEAHQKQAHSAMGNQSKEEDWKVIQLRTIWLRLSELEWHIYWPD